MSMRLGPFLGIERARQQRKGELSMVLILVFLTVAFAVLTRRVIGHFSESKAVSSARAGGAKFVYRLSPGY